MARILFLAHRIPYPPNKGDKIRSWHFLEHLLARHEVHAGFFIDAEEDLAHVSHLEELCASVAFEFMTPFKQKLHALKGLLTGKSLTESAYPSVKLKQYVQGLLSAGEIDLIFVFSAAPFGWLPDRLSGVPVVTDIVDVDSAKWEAYAKQARWPLSWIYAYEANRLRAFENKVASRSELALFVSNEEADLFRARLPAVESNDANIVGLSNGVDALRFDPANYPGGGKARLIFTGAMDYQPNVEAVTWFATNVWPKLHSVEPDIEFYIAGRPVAPEVGKLDGLPGVSVLGPVEDMAAEIAQATVVIAPLQTARGIQNKVLEGMAMAKPVVATPAANEGINAVKGQCILVAGSPDEFVAAIGGLLADAAKAEEIGRKARQFVVEEFSWQSKLSRFDGLLAPLLASKEPMD